MRPKDDISRKLMHQSQRIEMKVIRRARKSLVGWGRRYL
jgi:hypothetical protein